MEYIAIDALHPEWNVWLDFATMESISALRRDSIDGVQSVQVEVQHPDEISTLFDGAIVYAKGARLLRMLQQYIGHEAFQTGLKAYFATNAYANTDEKDLWSALSTASGKDITHFMNTWISQSGYPVVNVQLRDSKLTLSQQQFFTGPHEPSQKLWPIPLNASSSEVPEVLEVQTVTLPFHGVEPFRLNVGDTAHFITRYSDEILAGLIKELQSASLTSLDRLQLLHEQTLLARGGISSSATLIPLLDAYENETTEAVWDIISLAVGELKKFVETDKDAERQLRRLAARLARPQYERLGWVTKDTEPETDTKLRATILGMMVYGEDKDVIAKAISLYTNTDIEQLDPELRSIILSAAVRHGNDASIFESLLEQYKTTSSADLQQDIAAGLTSTKDRETLARLLELIKDSSVVRAQDVARWFVWIMRNRDGRILAWQWMRTNWPWIEETFGGDKSYDDYPRYAANLLVSRQQFQEYQDFFLPMQNDPSLSRAITIGIREIEGRVDLIERDSAAVQEALRQR